jgi:hypothetical protein
MVPQAAIFTQVADVAIRASATTIQGYQGHQRPRTGPAFPFRTGCPGQRNVNAVHGSALSRAMKHGVGGKLAAWTDDVGTFQKPPTVVTLAAQTYHDRRGRPYTLSKAQVKRQLQLLVALGVLVIVRESGGRRHPRIYRFNREALADAAVVAARLAAYKANRAGRNKGIIVPAIQAQPAGNKGIIPPEQGDHFHRHEERTEERSGERRPYESTSSGGAPRCAPDPDEADRNIGVITKLAHEAIDLVGVASPDLIDTVKALCAHYGVTYNGSVVRRGVESAEFQRRRLAAAVA